MRLMVGLLTTLVMMSCLVPEAEPIQGDVAAAIEKGISKGNQTFDHRVWDEILQQYAREEGRRFDYTGLKKEEGRLDGYLRNLAEVDLSTLPESELLALFANAYNAYTVKTILAEISPDGAYRIKSIRDISKPFDRAIHRVGGFVLSLDNIEHNIIRPIFQDPRAHFAVNCASISCPPIPTRAFAGQALDQQFDDVTRAVLSSPDYVRVEKGKLMVTRIMDWYRADFLKEGFKGSEKDLAAFIKKYTREEVRSWIEAQTSAVEVGFMDYDWSLNRY